MATVSPVQSLNIDGEVLMVADLGPKVQGFVSVYNEWNQKLENAKGEFLLVQAALNDLSRQIIGQIKQDQTDAAAKAASEGAPSAPVTTPDVAVVASDVPAAVSTDTPVITPTAKE